MAPRVMDVAKLLRDTDLSYSAIGRILGVTRQRASQVDKWHGIRCPGRKARRAANRRANGVGRR